MNELTEYGERHAEPPRGLRAIALVVMLIVLAGGVFALAGRTVSEARAAWHGNIGATVDCSGVHAFVSDVYSPQTLIGPSWSPAQNVSGSPGQTITITAFFSWTDSDHTDSDSVTKKIPDNCGTTTVPATTTTAPATTTTVTDTTPPTTIPDTTTTTAPTGDTTPTTAPEPPTTVTTEVIVVDTTVPAPSPTPVTSPRPQTTQPEPYCWTHPNEEGCTPEGLSTADAG